MTARKTPTDGDELIRVKCQQCSSVVRVADKYAGLKVKCPACKEALADTGGDARCRIEFAN